MILQPFAFIIWHMSDQTTLWNIEQASSILLLCSLLNLWGNIPQKAAWKFLISPGPSQRLLVVLGGWIQGKKENVLYCGTVLLFTPLVRSNTISQGNNLDPYVFINQHLLSEQHITNGLKQTQQGKPVCTIVVFTFWCRYWQYCGGMLPSWCIQNFLVKVLLEFLPGEVLQLPWQGGEHSVPWKAWLIKKQT